MKSKLSLLVLLALLPFAGCKKMNFAWKKPAAEPTPAASPAAGTVAAAAPAGEALANGQPVAAAAPAKAALAAEAAAIPPAPEISKNASVIVLCYHNVEDGSSMKALTISKAEFESEMQAIKDNGFTVIGMQDFLAWRRGEKNIPQKSAIITIDDGWVSGYTNAWPILKKFEYPFTLFIYVNYVNSGGKSLSWDQLAEMRDAGVDIQCHSYSHSNLRTPGGGVDRRTAAMVKKDIAELGLEGWRKKELIESKKVLEQQLGIRVNAFAYPFGIYNDAAREVIKEARYEAAFTVYGQQLGFSSPYDLLGRYAVEAAKPQIFKAALNMVGGGVVSSGPASGPSVEQVASSSMLTQPMDGATISDAYPTIRANISAMGAVDPKSVEMRISGLGLVPAKFDAKTKVVSYKPTQKLRPSEYTVILKADVAGKPVETRWSFQFDPKAKKGDSAVEMELPKANP